MSEIKFKKYEGQPQRLQKSEIWRNNIDMVVLDYLVGCFEAVVGCVTFVMSSLEGDIHICILGPCS